jgi:ribosomal protein S18 acetylase RimI-like enzyme
MNAVEKILKKNWGNLFLTPDYDPALVYKMFYRKKPGDMSVPNLDVTINVVYFETKLAGFVTYYIKKNHVGHLELLAIDSEFRNKGYGTFLIEHTVQECKKRGCSILQLYVYTSNPHAITFYEHLGFKLKANFGVYILMHKDI